MRQDIYNNNLKENFENSLTPSPDFTANVMQQLNKLVETKPVIEPLISTKIWWIVVAVFCSIGLFPLLFGIKEHNHSIWNNHNFTLSSIPDLKATINLMFSLLYVFGLLIIGDLFLRFKKVLA
tara:strand:+ start:4502 stop:4870 length:369 start_codon:yes stop_codon:yes gene_type:complete